MLNVQVWVKVALEPAPRCGQLARRALLYQLPVDDDNHSVCVGDRIEPMRHQHHRRARDWIPPSVAASARATEPVATPP
eukprot:scaffold5089_cov127-Isochrysis_galbana.AAC.1